MDKQLATALVLGGALYFVPVFIELAQVDTSPLFLLAQEIRRPRPKRPLNINAPNPASPIIGKNPDCSDRTPEVYITTKVPMIPTSSAGSAIISRMLRGSRSGNASGAATATRTGGTAGAGFRAARTKPRLDMPNLPPVG